MGLLQPILIALAVTVGLLLTARVVLRTLFPLPPMPARPESVALGGADTRLGQAVASAAQAHPGTSGVLLLADGRESFAARGALARLAERSLDLQYYIWHGDISGQLLLWDVLSAADRGVRVRLLLDDNGTAGLDRQLAALAVHPGIEIRLFNPFTIRSPKSIGYLMDFRRLNRRMHNKAFIADSSLGVIGGRNVGDEYFGATAESLFEDLDLLGAGPVVQALAADFDRYWTAQASYPLDAIVPVATEAALEGLRAELAAAARAPLAAAYAEAIEASVANRVTAGDALPFEWTAVSMLSDDPAKGDGEVAGHALLASRLAAWVGTPETRLSLVSAYFVPGDEGCAALQGLARNGITVDVMTNALEATDVAAVHAGYARHRAALLQAGVRLWELKAAPGGRTRLRLGLGSGPSGGGSRPVVVASGSSLHAKTFAVDGQRIFIGSFNFDPRSVALNTELGFLVESPTMAQGLHAAMEGGIAERAYSVRLTDTGRLSWVEQMEAGEVVHAREPGTRLHQRALVGLLALLPFEWLL
jgi:putative cardiolipin synthase